MYNFPKLYKGTLIKRYKRFFADVELDKNSTHFNNTVASDGRNIITVHNPNTGSMKSLLNNGVIPVNYPCLYSVSDNTARKLPYTLEAICVNNEWVVSNTIRVNSIVENGLLAGEIESLKNFKALKREFKYKDSKFDFFLDAQEPTFAEVKSVTYYDSDTCYFPDAVTTRGLKHLETLSDALKDGYRAVMIYVCMVKRNNFETAAHIDPDYAEALKRVEKLGVEKIVVNCLFDEKENSVKLIQV